MTISDFASSNINDKCDDFDFDIVNFPFLDGDIPRATYYGVYISQFIPFARASSHAADFNTRNKILTAKLLNYHKLPKAFFKILSTPLRLGILSEPEFYVDIVYKLAGIIFLIS